MKAVILAAGYATRLYPLTKDFPKPLLDVGGRPMIDYIVEKIAAVPEIDEIIVVTNSKFFPKFKRWAAAHPFRRRLRLLDDLTRSKDDRRGAIGDMYFAVKQRHLSDDVLVIGGDNLFDRPLGGFLSFARLRKNAPVIGVFDLGSKRRASQYGVVRLNRQSRIVDFQEKPPQPHSSCVAMCLYYFPRARLSLLRQYILARGEKKDATGFYIDWLRRKVAVYAYVFRGRWFDIGHFDFYRAAREEFGCAQKKKRSN